MIATADQDLTSRRLASYSKLHNKTAVSGIWSLPSLRNTVSFPKSFTWSISSSSSRELNAILNKLLRQDAQILRDLLASGADQATVQAKKEDLLQEIFNFLYVFRLPPRQFDFAYRDKDDNYQSEKGITPQEFYKKYVNLPLEDYVSVINAPTD